jgi:adenylate cyclase class IV
MVAFKNQKIIEKFMNHQKSMLLLNYMPQSLEKVEAHLNKIEEKNRVWKVRNSVHSVEVFHCSLDNIKPVGLFMKLTDLNIGDNPELKSLEGI